MTYEQAKILLDEASNLRYHPTAGERGFIEQISALSPAVLTFYQAEVVLRIYKKAAGAGLYERRQVIGQKHRYYKGGEL